MDIYDRAYGLLREYGLEDEVDLDMIDFDSMDADYMSDDELIRAICDEVGIEGSRVGSFSYIDHLRMMDIVKKR